MNTPSAFLRKIYVKALLLLFILLSIPVPLLAKTNFTFKQSDHKKLEKTQETQETHTLNSSTQTLIEQLGSQDYAQRQAAYNALWQRGKPSIELLKKAAKSNDPELAERALDLIYLIGASLRPNTPPLLRLLAKNYINALSPQQREVAIHTLFTQTSLEARLLLLRLIDSNPKHTDKVIEKPFIEQTTRYTAHFLKKEGKTQLLEEILALNNDIPAVQSMRAWYFLTQKGLQEALNVPSLYPEAWKAELYLHAEDFQKAYATLLPIQQSRHKALLSLLLQANPIDWLNNLDTLESDHTPTDLDLYKKLFVCSLQQNPSLLKKRIDALASELSPEKMLNLYAAFGLKQSCKNTGMATPFLWIHARLGLSEPSVLHSLLGIDPNAPAPYTQWVKERTYQALQTHNPEDYAALMYLSKSWLMRGEPLWAKESIQPLLRGLINQEHDHWHQLAIELIESQMGEVALNGFELFGKKNPEEGLLILRECVASILGFDFFEKEDLPTLRAIAQQKNLSTIHAIFTLLGWINEPSTLHFLEDSLQKVDNPHLFSYLIMACLHRGDLPKAHALAHKAHQRFKTQEWEIFANQLTIFACDFQNIKKTSFPAHPNFFTFLQQASPFLANPHARRTFFTETLGDIFPLYALANYLNLYGFKQDAYALLYQGLFALDKSSKLYWQTFIHLSKLITPQTPIKEALGITYGARLALLCLSDEPNAKELWNLYGKIEALQLFNQWENLTPLVRKKRFLALSKRFRGEPLFSDFIFPFLLHHHPKDPLLRALLNDHLAFLQQWEKACPHSSFIHNAIAWFIVQSHCKAFFALAQQHLDIALQQAPNSPEILDTQAALFFLEKNRQAAITTSQKALQCLYTQPSCILRPLDNDPLIYPFSNHIATMKARLFFFTHAPFPVL